MHFPTIVPTFTSRAATIRVSAFRVLIDARPWSYRRVAFFVTLDRRQPRFFAELLALASIARFECWRRLSGSHPPRSIGRWLWCGGFFLGPHIRKRTTHYINDSATPVPPLSSARVAK